jgi:hypothetical protein
MQVLVAHHDRWTRLVLADLLARAGFAVAEASNGMAALRLAAQARPDLVVLAAQLPEISTAEVRATLESGADTRGMAVFVLRDGAPYAPSGRIPSYRRACRHRRAVARWTRARVRRSMAVSTSQRVSSTGVTSDARRTASPALS